MELRNSEDKYKQSIITLDKLDESIDENMFSSSTQSNKLTQTASLIFETTSQFLAHASDIKHFEVMAACTWNVELFPLSFVFCFFFEMPNIFSTGSYARDLIYFFCEEPNTETHEGIISTGNIFQESIVIFLQSKVVEENRRLKNQLQSMTEQLNQSETVQRDFVRLSQSLQVFNFQKAYCQYPCLVIPSSRYDQNSCYKSTWCACITATFLSSYGSIMAKCLWHQAQILKCQVYIILTSTSHGCSGLGQALCRVLTIYTIQFFSLLTKPKVVGS